MRTSRAAVRPASPPRPAVKTPVRLLLENVQSAVAKKNWDKLLTHFDPAIVQGQRALGVGKAQFIAEAFGVSRELGLGSTQGRFSTANLAGIKGIHIAPKPYTTLGQMEYHKATVTLVDGRKIKQDLFLDPAGPSPKLGSAVG